MSARSIETLDGTVILSWACDEKTNGIIGQGGVCIWTETIHGEHQTQCGDRHIFIDGSPGENGYVYCPYCGGSIKTK